MSPSNYSWLSESEKNNRKTILKYGRELIYTLFDSGLSISNIIVTKTIRIPWTKDRIIEIKISFPSAKIIDMKNSFYYIQIFIKYWPLVNKVVQLVEKLKSGAPSEEKKAYALQMVTDALNLAELPEDKKQKITAFLSAFIDLVVGVNNLFGLWK